VSGPHTFLAEELANAPGHHYFISGSVRKHTQLSATMVEGLAYAFGIIPIFERRIIFIVVGLTYQLPEQLGSALSVTIPREQGPDSGKNKSHYPTDTHQQIFN
jgi:hypothetical protein